MEHIPRNGPFIIASNHQSHLDPLLVGLMFSRRPFASIARSSLFRFKPFAWLIHLFGAIPIKKGMGDANAIRATLAALEAGRPVLIFPEGTRTRDGGLGEFHRGITLLLKHADVPVLPVAVDGAFTIYPIGRRFPKLTGRLAVCAGPPINGAELLRDGSDPALQTLKKRIETMRVRLRADLREATGGRHPAHDAGDMPYWERQVGADATRAAKALAGDQAP